MRFIDATTIDRVLDMPSCIRAVEEAFRARGEGRPAPSAMLGMPLHGGIIHAKIAMLELSRSYVAAKVNANFPDNPRARGLPTVQGVLTLFDGTNGSPLVLMDSAAITTLRTAAASAVAASYLARADARVATFVGCGVQARAHLTALRRVRAIGSVFAVDAVPNAAAAFCRFARDECGIQAAIPESRRAALRESHVIVTTTPSRSAVLDVQDVSPGAFVAAVGADNEHKQEISPALMKASAIIADDIEQCAHSGDLHHALAANAMQFEDVRASLQARCIDVDMPNLPWWPPSTCSQPRGRELAAQHLLPTSRAPVRRSVSSGTRNFAARSRARPLGPPARRSTAWR